MANSELILKAENLTIGYRKGPKENVILKNINSGLYKGEFVCLIGPNGVGKSTLLRTLCGVQPPLSGDILLNGEDLENYDRQRLSREISLVLTEKITGNLTVYELIALGRYPHTNWSGTLTKIDELKIEQAVQDTHCEAIIHQKVYELSDGQLQKVMIARALAQDGDLMILDEPSAHLDLKNKVEILFMLQRLAKDHNKAILIATHELDLALQTADRIWLMAFNQPLVSGWPEDLALSGYITDAFRSDQFKFDPASGRLKVLSERKGKIAVLGKGIAYLWTCHALERCGYIVSKNSSIIVHVGDKNWIVESPGQKGYSVNSIEEVMDKIRT